jgi:hypothetical protein
MRPITIAGVAQRVVRDPRKPAKPEEQRASLLGATALRHGSQTGLMSASGRPPRQPVVGLREQRVVVAVSRERLARTIRERAADLRASRRECRDRQRELDALKAESPRLVTAASGAAGGDDQALAGPRATDKIHELDARWIPPEHTSAMLVLWRGKLALEEENASLRGELARLRATDSSRVGVTLTLTEDRSGRDGSPS